VKGFCVKAVTIYTMFQAARGRHKLQPGLEAW